MNMRELSALTGQPERQIRFMIAEGFVPAPRGERVLADYGDNHVVAIRRYVALKGLGLPPKAIAVLLATESGAPFPLVDGITLTIAPELIGTPINVDAVITSVRKVLSEIATETPHDPSSSARCQARD